MPDNTKQPGGITVNALAEELYRRHEGGVNLANNTETTRIRYKQLAQAAIAFLSNSPMREVHQADDFTRIAVAKALCGWRNGKRSTVGFSELSMAEQHAYFEQADDAIAAYESRKAPEREAVAIQPDESTHCPECGESRYFHRGECLACRKPEAKGAAELADVTASDLNHLIKLLEPITSNSRVLAALKLLRNLRPTEREAVGETNIDNFVLPFDVKMGAAVFRKGVRLKTLVNAGNRWHKLASDFMTAGMDMEATREALTIKTDIEGGNS